MNTQTETKPLRVGIVGAGVFGGFHAAKVASTPNVTFSGVYDPDKTRAGSLADKHRVEAHPSLVSLLHASDAIIIASPADTHGTMVSAALCGHKHVYVEKPLADTGTIARALAHEAVERGLVLQVGHQERFVFAAMGVFALDEKPISVEAVREGPPSGRGLDTSVTMDLMIHDLDLVLALFRDKAISVTAERLLGEPGRADAVSATIAFKGGGHAKLLASRNAPELRRTMKVVYPNATVEIDFVARTFSNDGNLPLNPNFSAAVPDPLRVAFSSFVAACRAEAICPVPGVEAAEAVVLAETIDAAAG